MNATHLSAQEPFPSWLILSCLSQSTSLRIWGKLLSWPLFLLVPCGHHATSCSTTGHNKAFTGYSYKWSYPFYRDISQATSLWSRGMWSPCSSQYWLQGHKEQFSRNLRIWLPRCIKPRVLCVKAIQMNKSKEESLATLAWSLIGLRTELCDKIAWDSKAPNSVTQDALLVLKIGCTPPPLVSSVLTLKK